VIKLNNKLSFVQKLIAYKILMCFKCPAALVSLCVALRYPLLENSRSNPNAL